MYLGWVGGHPRLGATPATPWVAITVVHLEDHGTCTQETFHVVTQRQKRQNFWYYGTFLTPRRLQGSRKASLLAKLKMIWGGQTPQGYWLAMVLTGPSLLQYHHFSMELFALFTLQVSEKHFQNSKDAKELVFEKRERCSSALAINPTRSSVERKKQNKWGSGLSQTLLLTCAKKGNETSSGQSSWRGKERSEWLHRCKHHRWARENSKLILLELKPQVQRCGSLVFLWKLSKLKKT